MPHGKGTVEEGHVQMPHGKGTVEGGHDLQHQGVGHAGVAEANRLGLPLAGAAHSTSQG